MGYGNFRVAGMTSLDLDFSKVTNPRDIHVVLYEGFGQDEISLVHFNLADEDVESFIRQACIDGAAFNFHTWSSDDDDADEAS
jgi:hypothetical protein